jgi:hypothetical protein
MPTTQIKGFDVIKQTILGVGAFIDGQSFEVRRNSPTTNIGISSNRPVIPFFAARVEPKPSKRLIENSTHEILVFEASCNNLRLKEGDVLKQYGWKNDGSVFTYAQARPMQSTIFVRTEATCSLSRPMPTAGQAAQQPSSGIVAAASGEYMGIAKSTEWFLTLINGDYAFSSDPSIPHADVYVGLQPLHKVADGNNVDLPTALYREKFMCWIPQLPGEMLTELDRIRFQNSDVYELAEIFSTDSVGLSGYICLVERINV